MQVCKINDNVIFDRKFTFCTLVTRYEEYLEMVDSAKNKGFIGEDVEYIYFDNKESNKYDGFSGINRALKEAKGEYLIFCHQDIIFHDDDRKKLESCLNELEAKDLNWAIAGNAGLKKHGIGVARITDPNQLNVTYGALPEKVMSIDENFILINRKHTLCCSSNLKGFHLYGLDLCQNAQNLGLNAYVIDFHLLHKSGGKLDESFYKVCDEYIEIQLWRKKYQLIWTTCTHFYISNNRFFNWLFSFEYLFLKKNRFDKRLDRLKEYLKVKINIRR